MSDGLEYDSPDWAIADHWIIDEPYFTRYEAPIPFAKIRGMLRLHRKLFGRPRRGRALHRAIKRHRLRIARP